MLRQAQHERNINALRQYPFVLSPSTNSGEPCRNTVRNINTLRQYPFVLSLSEHSPEHQYVTVTSVHAEPVEAQSGTFFIFTTLSSRKARRKYPLFCPSFIPPHGAWAGFPRRPAHSRRPSVTPRLSCKWRPAAERKLLQRFPRSFLSVSAGYDCGWHPAAQH